MSLLTRLDGIALVAIRGAVAASTTYALFDAVLADAGHPVMRFRCATPVRPRQAKRPGFDDQLDRVIELPDNQIAVVASAGLLAEPDGVLWHSMLHEAQHVRMMHNGWRRGMQSGRFGLRRQPFCVVSWVT